MEITQSQVFPTTRQEVWSKLMDFDVVGRSLPGVESLEPIDTALAEAAYRRVLELDPQHVHATINLGALLCEAGRPDEAVTLFDTAIARGLRDPLIHYNRAIALEDRGDARGAIASYLRALELDTGLADAHFNLARLYEEAGDAHRAVRHLASYRRLQRD